jgi:small subunit ribosomal protein S2
VSENDTAGAQLNTQEKNPEIEAAVKEMIDAGVFYGKKKSKTHPRMKPFILNNRNGIEIINLYKTLETLERAEVFVKEKVPGGGMVLLVATQPAFEEEVLAAAKRLECPAVTRRWLGGTLTNFKVISKRMEYYHKLKSDSERNAFDRYTKKERVRIEHEVERLGEFFRGLERLTRLPDMVLVIDPVLHTAAVREARRLRIPVIGFSNVDCDPETLDVAVIGNTKGKTSVLWFLAHIERAIAEARKKAPEPLPAAQPVAAATHSGSDNHKKAEVKA